MTAFTNAYIQTLGAITICYWGQSSASLEYAMLQLWQLPLGLLFCLQSQPALIQQFFEGGQALPQWYESQFIPCRGRVLALAPCTNAPELPRYSPAAKLLLAFRCNGLRCSASELLLFLAFAPLSSPYWPMVWAKAKRELAMLLVNRLHKVFGNKPSRN